MACPPRSASRNYLGVDDTSALLSSQLQAFSGVTCTCGAGEELEAERHRVAQRSQDLAERGETLLLQETDLEQRVLGLEARKESVAANATELRKRHADFDAKLAHVDVLLREAAKRQEGSRLWEEMLSKESERLRCIELDVQAQEEAVAAEELALIGQRNCAEEGLEKFRSQYAALDSEASTHIQLGEAEAERLEEVEQEWAALGDDEMLLTEIEAQLDPIRQSLAAREARVADEEFRLTEREAACEDSESSALPAWRRSLEQLEVLEERSRELKVRETESEQHQLRLLQRQRDLGGSEIRLSGLEGALQRSDAAGGTLPRSDPILEDPEEMRKRLAKLRLADATWGERVREQHSETQRLEAQVQTLEARAKSSSPKNNDCIKLTGLRSGRANVKTTYT